MEQADVVSVRFDFMTLDGEHLISGLDATDSTTGEATTTVSPYQAERMYLRALKGAHQWCYHEVRSFRLMTRHECHTAGAVGGR